MELPAQVQHDVGEGPYLQAYAQDQAVVVEDLGAAPVWVRLAAVVGQLRVLAVLSVRPRSAVALTRREYHPARQTPASRLFVLDRRRP